MTTDTDTTKHVQLTVWGLLNMDPFPSQYSDDTAWMKWLEAEAKRIAEHDPIIVCKTDHKKRAVYALFWQPKEA